MIDQMFSNQLSEYGNVLIIVGIALIVYEIFAYIATAITMFSIGKRRGTKAYGLAWVPVLRVWTLGAIGDEFDLRRGEKDHKWRYVMLVLSLAALAGGVIYGSSCVRFTNRLMEIAESGALDSATADPLMLVGIVASMMGSMLISAILMSLCSAGSNVCAWICHYKLFNSCKPQKPVVLLLLSAMVPFAYPFVMLACKNCNDGENCKETRPELTAE